MIAGRENPPDPRLVGRKLAAIAAALGQDIRRERERRRLSTHELAAFAGLSQSAVSGVESGRVASLQTYTRIALALRLQPESGLVDPRRRTASRAEDPVHAALGEIVASRLTQLGLIVRIDEPYQHYQFAGRGDVVAWTPDLLDLVHVENRTRFPNIQEAMGSFASKRAYLAESLAERLHVGGWRSETHLVLALWSAETLHAARLHAATFRAGCPDPPDTFRALWAADRPSPGRHATLVLFDPLEGRRSDRRRWIGLDDALNPNPKPRYRDYAEALDALRQAGLA